uniref:Uncharacterized protein n=1 Tax=Brassica campestris TaxID=3711 RepID=A0A3P5YGX3_BRACM|nr:unnamed protein product [Brassica rapa]
MSHVDIFKIIVIFDGDQGQWVGCLVTQYYIRCCLASLAGVCCR